MRDFLDQVEAASAADLYYLALEGALVLPDMAAAMVAPDGGTNRTRYVDWFAQHAAPRFNLAGMQFISGEDCYGLRCSMLHQGRMTPHRGNYSRVLFYEPSTSKFVAHLNVINDALNIDVRVFVADMVAATRGWLDRVEGTETYQRNYQSTMQRHPDGLPGSLGGSPVIA